MRYLTHNEITINSTGTSGRGRLRVSYERLVKTFGPPKEGDGDKVDAQWAIKFSDRLIGTIYNYKNGRAYLGAEGTPTLDIIEWNIGGNNDEVVRLILAAIEEAGI